MGSISSIPESKCPTQIPNPNITVLSETTESGIILLLIMVQMQN